MRTINAARADVGMPAAVKSDAVATDDRFLSREACTSLAKQVASAAVGGGFTQTCVDSTWAGSIRWARNRINLCADTRNNDIWLRRTIHGAFNDTVRLNQIDPAALEAAMRRAERTLRLRKEGLTSELDVEFTEQHLSPTIWSDTTYGLSAEARVEVVRALTQKVEQAGMLAAGYIEVSGQGRAVMSSRGRAMYYPYTDAQYSVTVRDPKGTGSGWAGLSHYDWTKIDAHVLTERALDKCLRSRNPVTLEPGRYTTILEPQAVCDFMTFVFDSALDRPFAETTTIMDAKSDPYWLSPGQSKLGLVVMDERLNVGTDPMEPEMGFAPFFYRGFATASTPELEVYHPARWIKDGVLMNLSHSRDYAIQKLGKANGQPYSGSYRMWSSVPPIPVDEMIATTKRGLLVTRFYLSGWRLYTRDGLWLIENGKISKPVKNFGIDEIPYFTLQANRLEQIGTPERVYHPLFPVMVPALKIKDFNFNILADAV